MRKTMSTATVESAVRAGRAELLGNRLGDPVYLSGAFWQISADSSSYEIVVDLAQASICASLLPKLRIARTTPPRSR